MSNYAKREWTSIEDGRLNMTAGGDVVNGTGDVRIDWEGVLGNGVVFYHYREVEKAIETLSRAVQEAKDAEAREKA